MGRGMGYSRALLGQRVWKMRPLEGIGTRRGAKSPTQATRALNKSIGLRGRFMAQEAMLKLNYSSSILCQYRPRFSQESSSAQPSPRSLCSVN